MATRFILFSLLALSTGSAIAGMTSGLYVVWFDLGGSNSIEKILVASTNNTRDDCRPNGAILFIHKKPKALTEPLIRSGLIDKSPEAIRKIDKALKASFMEFHDGLDGVVAYTNRPTPRFVSLDRDDRMPSTSLIKDINNPRSVLDAFCLATPVVKRSP